MVWGQVRFRVSTHDFGEGARWDWPHKSLWQRLHGNMVCRMEKVEKRKSEDGASSGPEGDSATHAVRSRASAPGAQNV